MMVTVSAAQVQANHMVQPSQLEILLAVASTSLMDHASTPKMGFT